MNIRKTNNLKYDFKEIEEKWQKYWEKKQLFKAPEKPGANKFYVLVMFLYPSGDIHMGHFRNYIIGDALARYQMMNGKDVLHPFGWDAFGLPAERAAIQRGLHPAEWTEKNIDISRKTLQKAGISYDWSREVNSCHPDYYKWTQWMFVQLFKKGLAYQKTGWVNWCPEDKTVLANEQVVDGKCERCETPVEKKELKQWYLKITEYADRLLDGLDSLSGWPENVKVMQREWIGRSEGLEVDFILEETGEKIPIFTTRPDTIYGVTFMAVAPESPLIDKLNLDGDYRARVEAYQKQVMLRPEFERTAVAGEKDGVFTGKYAINPFNDERVQLWVADYVLAGYGTGAVMAVPAHDSRDFLFAKKYNIPIKIVIQPEAGRKLNAETMNDAYTEYGVMVNSGGFNGLVGIEAREKISAYAEDKNIGRKRVNFKLRDWLVSRQRYWGAPIPIIHCSHCGPVAVEERDLPVVLPEVESFLPKGRSPLADVPAFMNVDCPRCGRKAERDPDTMDTFVCSSWYYLRYTDPKNEDKPFDRARLDPWMPIDQYIGGITHATGHLIYFRFFHKFLKDIGWVKDEEPATRLFNHGMVLDSNGEVMRKSRGNVVSPIGIMEARGVDIARLGTFFFAPSEKEILWSEDVLVGIEKFIRNRFFRLVERYRGTGPDLKYRFISYDLSECSKDSYIRLNQTIRKVTEDIEKFQFNTAIAALMELERDFDSSGVTENDLNDYIILKMIQLMAPMAPHLCEEMWNLCGGKGSVFESSWPIFDPDAVQFNSVSIAIQINGKLRSQMDIVRGTSKEDVVEKALRDEKIRKYIGDKEIVKEIYIEDRLLNLVIR
jgi:leucyl-tRNA synthetase